MNNPVRIDKEIVRLAQSRVRTTGTPLSPELARLVAEESVVNVDLDAGLILEGDAYSQDDALVAALAVNDLVVNGAHVDVRAIDAHGRVAVQRCLVGTSYLQNGSLVVALDETAGGRVVAHIPASVWAENTDGEAETVQVAVGEAAGFSLEAALSTLTRPTDDRSETKAPDGGELTKFVAARKEIPLSRQNQIVETLFARQDARQKLAEALSMWSDGTLSRILGAASIWNARVERMVDKLAPKFSLIKRSEIKDMVLKVGEAEGGQTETPGFKRAVVTSLARAEMVRRLKGADLAKALAVVDRVLAGRSVSAAVGDFVKSKVSLEIAQTIKRGRREVEGFVSATAEEIGMAFQQLALQPAYATHSHDAEAGVESINEALEMLEAGDVAERLAEIEKEI